MQLSVLVLGITMLLAAPTHAMDRFWYAEYRCFDTAAVMAVRTALVQYGWQPALAQLRGDARCTFTRYHFKQTALSEPGWHRELHAAGGGVVVMPLGVVFIGGGLL